MSTDINEIIFYLRTARSREEVRKEFELSNSESFHILRWLEKGKFINVESKVVSGKTNRTWYYEANKRELPKLDHIVMYTSEVYLCQTLL